MLCSRRLARHRQTAAYADHLAGRVVRIRRREKRYRAREVFGLINSDELDVRIGGTYPLADARRAQEDLAARRTTGKLLLLPGL